MRRYAIVLFAVLAFLCTAATQALAAQNWYEDSQEGQTYARLDYTDRGGYGSDRFTDVRVQIVRGGQLVFNQTIEPHCDFPCGVWPVGGTNDKERSIHVRDLNADDEPEVTLDFYTGGANCCLFTYVAYRRPDGGYSLKRRPWSLGGYDFKDYKGDGLIEFRARDPRWRSRFASTAGTWEPLQIWNFRSGTFVDVTRHHKAAVAADARGLWRRYRRYRRANREVRGVLAAYVGNAYSLGKGRRGLRRASRAIRGRGRCFDCQRPGSFIRQLKRLLRRTGYTR
jgi:hypothetical protein